MRGYALDDNLNPGHAHGAAPSLIVTTGENMDEYRIVQVADLHLGAGQEHHLDNWLKVSDWIARERPDLVVLNGDLIMGDPDNEADHAFARSRIAQLPVPRRHLPGNHDIGDNVVSG